MSVPQHFRAGAESRKSVCKKLPEKSPEKLPEKSLYGEGGTGFQPVSHAPYDKNIEFLKKSIFVKKIKKTKINQNNYLNPII